ncbi:MAG: hypothetical protein RL199_308 [Pseudomonadota bacterium]|jgi:hypothetical protein
MSTLSPDVLRELGLPADTQLLPPITIDVPQSGGDGSTHGRVAGFLLPVLQVVGASTAFRPLVDIEAKAAATPVAHELCVTDADRSVLLVSADVEVTGAAVWTEGGWVLDGREKQATARISTEEATAIAQVGPNGRITLTPVDPHLPDAWRKLERWQPSTRAPVAAPHLESVLRGAAMEAWLAEETTALLAAPGVVPRTAALGLAVRLHRPDPADAARLLQQRLAGGPRPIDLALEWVAARSDAERAQLVDDALGDAGRLSEAVEDLASLASSSPEEASDAFVDWLVARDDLESVLLLVTHGRLEGAESLGAALASADKSAAAYHSLWSTLDLPDTDRLSAVADCDPSCWWAAFA